LLLILPLLAAAANAQTISPVIVEYAESARGSFEIRNDSFTPLTVILEPRSFSVDADGKPLYRPLDSEIRLDLSTKSFRIGPQQTYTVFYRARAERLPAWFTIYATITGPTTPTGIKLVLELPHTVYLLTRHALDARSVIVHRAESAGLKTISVDVENQSQDFARVQEVEISTKSTRRRFPGFPFFPGQRRRITLEWDQPDPPGKLVLKFAKFQLEHPIATTTRSP
jgi:hypothetical protein